MQLRGYMSIGGSSPNTCMRNTINVVARIHTANEFKLKQFTPCAMIIESKQTSSFLRYKASRDGDKSVRMSRGFEMNNKIHK